jgi:competence protein ComEC
MRLCIVAFACGIALLQLQRELPGSEWLAALAALGVVGQALWAVAGGSAAIPGWSWRSFWCVLFRTFGAALLGFAWAGWLAQQRLADALPEAWELREIALTGVVASLPQRFERGERFVFAVESAQPSAAIVPRHIQLSWYHASDEFGADSEPGAARSVRPGQRWRFTVRLKRPHGNANPHGFDYEAWLLERNIRATGNIRGSGERADDFVARPGYAIERLRDALRNRFVGALPDAPYLGVLIALAVGDQRAIANDQWTVFNRTGVTHLMSISGLHVTMVAALGALLIDVLWRRSARLLLWRPAQQAAVVAGWLAALAYALLAGFEVPAQRTLYMLSVVAAALLSGRNFGVARTVLLALLAVLVLDPWAVLAIGFWLSFGAVALLLFVGSARLRESRGARASLARWGAAQWAVSVGSLPLLLLFFQQFSLVSPLANALAIPLVSLVITPLALVFAVLPWPPLLIVDHWLLAQLMRLLEALAGWPLWQQPAPPLWATLLALVGVAWLLLPRGFPARAVGLCLLLPALCWPPPRPAPGDAWVEVLDVGQGLAVLVRTARHALLYDAGPAYGGQANAGARVVVPYLRAVGVDALDALVLTHRDRDHTGGAAAVQAALPVARLLSSLPELPGERCRAGQSWEWDGVRFVMLHPLAADYLDPGRKSNRMSCVLRVGNGLDAVLLTADLEAADESALLARSPLASALLVAPHHGGKGSSTPEFIVAVGARQVIFSAGYRNPFNHPHPAVLERYAASRQWRTDRDGALSIALAAGTVDVSAWRETHRRYWYGK